MLAVSSVGLDISDHAVRFVEFIKTGDGLRLARYGREVMPPGILEGGEVRDRGRLVALLEHIAREHKLNFVHSALPAEQAYFFQVSAPAERSYSALRSFVEFSMEERVPIPAREAIFDFSSAVPRQKARSPETLNVVAVPKKSTENYAVQPGLKDLFLYSGKHDPAMYFDLPIRNGISSFSDLAHREEVETGLELLANDIKSGRISEIISSYANAGGDYLFIKAVATTVV